MTSFSYHPHCKVSVSVKYQAPLNYLVYIAQTALCRYFFWKMGGVPFKMTEPESVYPKRIIFWVLCINSDAGGRLCEHFSFIQLNAERENRLAADVPRMFTLLECVSVCRGRLTSAVDRSTLLGKWLTRLQPCPRCSLMCCLPSSSPVCQITLHYWWPSYSRPSLGISVRPSSFLHYEAI